MTESIPDRLILAAGHLEVTEDAVLAGEPSAADMESLATYLHALAKHGRDIAELALDAVDRAASGSPVRASSEGSSVQIYLGHAQNLFEAAQTFAGDAKQLLKQMDLAEN
jgi:hypothetical protein